MLGNISYIAPYLKNGNFHEVIGIKEGSTLSEFNKCREGKSKPPYIRSPYPRSLNVHNKSYKADNHHSSSDHKSRRNISSDNQIERSSGKSSPSSVVNYEQSKSKKDHQYNVNSTTDHAATSSQHHRILGDRNVKTELRDTSATFSVLTSKVTTPKTEVDSKQHQVETKSTIKLEGAEDLKSIRVKIEPKLEDNDELSQSNGTSLKSKPTKSDNDMKGNSIRPKHLTIDIITKLVIIIFTDIPIIYNLFQFILNIIRKSISKTFNNNYSYTYVILK